MYLQELKEGGVTNIDMEATVIGAMCNAVGEWGSWMSMWESEWVEVSGGVE